MSEFTDRWLKRVRAAQQDLIDDCGGIKRVAELTSMSTSQVGRWRSPTDQDVVTVKTAMILQGAAGRPRITEVMMDFDAFTRSGVPESVAGASELSAHVADMMDHVGRIFSEAMRAQADGQITPAEAARLRRLCSAAAKFISELDAMLAGVESAGGVSVFQGGRGG